MSKLSEVVEMVMADNNVKKAEEEVKDVVISTVVEVFGKSWSCCGWELLLRKVQPSPLPVPAKPEVVVSAPSSVLSPDTPATV
jgi:hypothetical protein